MNFILELESSDKVEGSVEKGIAESADEIHAMNGQKKHQDSEEGNNKINKADPKGSENVAYAYMNVPGEVNMEAEITADDVMRAGGFGARDDIGSFLPTAVDTTDFEASLRDARDYEEPQVGICRPGLGWTEEAAKK